MSSPFLRGNTITGLADGSANINIYSATIQSLSPNQPVLTNANKQLISSKLAISDTTGLATALAEKTTLDWVHTTTPANPDAGKTRTYFKADDKYYKLTSAGVESEIGGGGGMGGHGTWLFNTATSGDPGVGAMLYNSATPASATSISFSKTDDDGGSQTVLLATVKDGDQFHLNDAAGTDAKLYTVTSAPTDNGTYFTWTCVLEAQDNTSNYTNTEPLTVDVIIQNPFNQNLNTTDDVKFNSVEATTDIINEINSRQYSTGLLEGGIVSATIGTALFSISAGSGVIVDQVTGTHTKITWNAIVDQNISTLGPMEQSHIFYFDDSSGVVKEQFVSASPAQRRDRVYVGGIALDPTFAVIVSVAADASMAICPMSNLVDLADVIGPINITGNIVSSVTLLTLIKSVGSLYSIGANWGGNQKDPSTVPIPVMDSDTGGDTFSIGFRDTVDPAILDIHTISASSILPAIYDDGNGSASPGSVGNNEWTVMHVILSLAGNTIVMPGQKIYTDIGSAIEGTTIDPFTVPTNLTAGSTTIAFLVCKGNMADFSNDANTRIIQASKFGTSGSGTSTSTLQNTYDNSSAPQITTNDGGGSIQFQRGTTGGDTDDVLEILSGGGVPVMSATGDGTIIMRDPVNPVASAVTGLIFADNVGAGVGALRTGSGDVNLVATGGDVLLTATDSLGDVIMDVGGGQGKFTMQSSGSAVLEGSGPFMDVRDNDNPFGTATGSYILSDNAANPVGALEITGGNTELKGIFGSLSLVANNAAKMTFSGNASASALIPETADVKLGSAADPFGDVYIGRRLNFDSAEIIIGKETTAPLLTGNTNVIVGEGAMSLATSAYANVVIGEDAGQTLVSGGRNVIIGEEADVGAGTENSIALGAGTVVSGGREFVVGRATGNSIRCWLPGAATGTDLGDATHQFEDLYMTGSIIGGSIAGGAWQNPTYNANIESISGVRQMRYRANADSIEIEGALKYKTGFNLGVGSNVTLFTLAVGFRPDEKYSAWVQIRVAGSYISVIGVWVEINTDGTVVMFNSSDAPVAISEVHHFSVNMRFSLT